MVFINTEFDIIRGNWLSYSILKCIGFGVKVGFFAVPAAVGPHSANLF